VMTSTFLVILFAPLFYVLIVKNFGRHSRHPSAKGTETTPSGN
jgi:hypothetical protein